MSLKSLGDVLFKSVPQTKGLIIKNGLACISHIIGLAPNHLVQSGWLLLEHGYDQAGECKRLFANAGFSNICSYPDLAGIMRVSGGQMNTSM